MFQMVDALVLIEYGMKVFGHCDPKSYVCEVNILNFYVILFFKFEFLDI
jgi:hypothetical protein